MGETEELNDLNTLLATGYSLQGISTRLTNLESSVNNLNPALDHPGLGGRE